MENKINEAERIVDAQTIAESEFLQAVLAEYQDNYNCAEALLRAANRVYGLGIAERDLRLAGAFGGGMQCGSTCGALSAGAMVLSAMLIDERAHETASLRKDINELVRNFKQELHGMTCAQIKPLFFDPETRCLSTVLHSAIALEKTIQSLQLQNACQQTA